MSGRNEQLSPAELHRWGATIATMQECDKAAGITDPGTTAAAEALGRVWQAQRGTA